MVVCGYTYNVSLNMSDPRLADFDPDAEKAIVNCKTCNEEHLLLEHSVFEDGYLLYCDACSRRVDISIYDDKYQEIHEGLKSKFANFDDRDDSISILMNALEDNLSKCSCGETFKKDAKRRCFNCNEVLRDFPSYMNTWYFDSFDLDSNLDSISKYVLEPEWK